MNKISLLLLETIVGMLLTIVLLPFIPLLIFNYFDFVIPFTLKTWGISLLAMIVLFKFKKIVLTHFFKQKDIAQGALVLFNRMMSSGNKNPTKQDWIDLKIQIEKEKGDIVSTRNAEIFKNFNILNKEMVEMKDREIKSLKEKLSKFEGQTTNKVNKENT